ncbi:MAG: hypothetical protein Q9177_005533, partial [Variospora cf. flavescens]
MSSQTAGNNGPTFCGLPPEIRHMIYQYIYVGITSLNLERNDKGTILCTPIFSRAILLACKMCYSEAKPIFDVQRTRHVFYDQRVVEDGVFLIRSFNGSRITTLTVDVSLSHPCYQDLYLRFWDLLEVPSILRMRKWLLPALKHASLNCERLYQTEEVSDEQFYAPGTGLAVTVKPRYVDDVPTANFEGDHSIKFVLSQNVHITRIAK